MTHHGVEAPHAPVARQPISCPDGRVLGHEYLYRSRVGLAAGVDRWPPARQDAASAAVLHTLYGHHAPCGTGLVFVNVTRAFLVGERPLPPADHRLVLEVVESVPADAATLAGLARLRAHGYRVALDDWTASPAQCAMLRHADFVKVDCRDLEHLGEAGLREARTGGARLVAERVADEQLRAHCIDLRFDLLQGYALGRPALIGA
ncbi:EAL domain-containing protein [Cellulomonas dongxiuzhuiae]|uniref:EAL domain-containing protein n=1 Tax=Cellulomonas dongxiuzhuiae TaxID=2819979 RepID=A0ABX8GGD9_9CELL|nr:EAL domain-containing protein [Cellulomonas dongxiuzhuiae]MBO3086816.1 EAL domain-containing protein [Cellulomonas dongxiuzhuiae]MBO3093832.1 EAL domain-containing protein [Cellulomonas dongxiuzhuiae]QWC14930.1 EAL domain-containing protein [Cellulomonas dongxiuzhuiae]